MKKIVISASYSGTNLGDEAILESIIKNIYKINKGFKVIVLAWDRQAVSDFHKELFKKYDIKVSQEIGGRFQLKQPSNFFSILKSFFCIASSDFFIWGGGGIINDEGYYLSRYLLTLRIAQFFKKKTFVFAVGVKKIPDKKMLKIVKNCVEKASLVSVRDQKSKENLLSMGVNTDIKVVADPAFLLVDNSKNTTSKDSYGQVNIGLNLRPWFDRIIHGLEERRKIDVAISNLAVVLLELKKEINFKIYYFPFDLKKDKAVLKKIKKLISQEIEINYIKQFKNLHEMKENFKKMDVFIGMRLHSIIFSIILNIPFYSISYTEKTSSLIELIDCRDNYVELEDLASIDFDHNKLKDKIKNLIMNKEKNVNLSKNKKYIIQKAEKNISLLKLFFYE